MNTMTTPTVVEPVLDISADGILNTVQTKRLKMLLGLEEIDKNKRYLMNELSETAVAIKKIESEEDIAVGNKEGMDAVAEAIRNLNGNPYHRSQIINGESTVVDPEVPAIEIKPEEDSLELASLNYETFIPKKTK